MAMSLLPIKSFELEIAPLQHSSPQGILINKVPPEANVTLSSTPSITTRAASSQHFIPLGLRWREGPEIGIPRQPFFVYRRNKSKGDPFDRQFNAAQAAAFNDNGVFSVAGQPFYILYVIIDNNDPTKALTVTAIDDLSAPITRQNVSIPAKTAKTIRFQHPFICGFTAKGNFTIKAIMGVTMKNFSSRTDEWELIQIVGLPAQANEVPGYEPGQQGYVNHLGDPVENARKRLKIAQPFYVPLPTTLPSGMQVPIWKIPNENEAVEELRKGSPPLLERIGNMLKAVDNGDVHAQSDFLVNETIPGIGQPEFPDSKTPDAVISLPLLATVLINAVTDPWFALASGFGTTDFPLLARQSDRFVEPVSYFHVSHDYMVTSKFNFRYDGEVFIDPVYSEEYYALSHKSILPPLPPNNLVSSMISLNRPPHRDDPWSVEGALTWTKINKLQIQGNAIAVAEAGVNGIYLNMLRPAPVAHQPALFVPTNPGETGDPELKSKNRFVHSQTHLPFINSRVNKYGVASMDCFGRWSDWKETQLTLEARVPESPRLIALSLTVDRNRISGNTAPAELLLEIAWDWQDRSPKTFQVAGVFHKRLYLPDGTKDNGHIPPSDYPSIFQTNNSLAVGPLLELTFSSDTLPGTPPVFTDTPSSSDTNVIIELLPQATNQNGENVEGEMRRYRIRKDVMMAFRSDEEWYFTVFAKAAEWRNPALFSDTVLPLPANRPPKLTVYIANPIPAPPPEFDPPDIIWTPLPDARGISRFRLSFNKIPNATGGYAVYRAFEAKIRDICELPVRDDTNLISRATDLRDIAMLQKRSLDAFTRLNEKLIPPPAAGAKVEYEVEIDGTMDGLLIFAVASVTREQETSAHSKPWLFVAVPRRAVPGLPLLSLVQQNGASILSCDFPKAPKPSMIEIFRSRRELISKDVEMMGIPLLEVTEPGWQALDEENKPPANPDKLHHFRLSVTVSTPPSWFPYYYRASGIGQSDAVNGFIAGRSQQSNLVKVERLPIGLPDIREEKAVQNASQSVIVTFKSDAVIETTPYGNFHFEIYAYNFIDKKFEDDPVSSLLLKDALPQIVSPVKKQIYYSEADATGFRTFQLLLDVTETKFLYKIRLSDPLTRTSERMLSGTMAPGILPNLSNLQSRKKGKDLLIFFQSTTPFTPQVSGKFILEISFVQRLVRNSKRLMRLPLDKIKAGNLPKLELASETVILRDINGHLPEPVKYGANFEKFYSFSGFPSLRGAIRVRLTAPDNTSVVVSKNI